jgi:small subunit ribosomal protein S5
MADFRRREQEPKEFEEKVVQIDRVTRVVKGGRRIRFRATVVVGDKKGRVGVASDKGAEVVTAIEKATTKAKKGLKTVNLMGTTIPHEITAEFAGAKVFLKPARKGTGVIAGGAVRAVLEVAGVSDILSKIQGSSSKLNNVFATMKALEALKKFDVVEPAPKKDKPKAEKKATEKVSPKKEATKKSPVKKATKETPRQARGTSKTESKEA